VTGAATTAWGWLEQVNAEALGGHTDWRIASLTDIATLAPHGCPLVGPCFDPVFNVDGPDFMLATTTTIEPDLVWRGYFRYDGFSDHSAQFKKYPVVFWAVR